MTERSARPPVQLIQNVYQRLFHDGVTLSKLRDTLSQGRLQSNHGSTVGVPGRSLAWKMFLLRGLEPLERPSDEVPSVPIELLRESRKQFSELLLEKMRAPDGSYDESFVVPGLTIPRRSSSQAPLNLETNNPLSLHEENPWKEWFAAMDLRKIIQQDVERTFPDMGYFRSNEVQYQLTNVLFLYSVMHPDISYRQGMHELLAPLYYAIDFDSVPEAHEIFETDSHFAEFCSRAWVAADSWTLFSAVMQKVSQWYEWREPAPPPPTARGPINLKPYVPPIVEACNRIQGSLLKSVDPTLYEAMQNAGIEPQIYGLRWLRLLFTREFPMDEAMMLWDGLFASSSLTPDLVMWLCVAMLIRIRTKLIPSDYSTQLMYLLRYPPCPPTEPGAPHHIVLLIRHATALEISPNPATGATLMMENRNLLNIPLDVPDPLVARRRPRQPERTHQATSSESSTPGISGSQVFSPQLSFPELLARGLLDRGESLGINRTVMNAVSELKRNLPDLTSNLVRSPSFATSTFSAYPLLDEKSPEERYIRNHRSDLESARELADLRRQNKRLGEAVGWALDILGQESASDTYQLQRKQALESLSYMRDVLTGQVEEVDERRLWGEAEFKRRWEVREKSASPSSESSLTGRDARSGTTSAKLTAARENRRFSQGNTSSISGGGHPRSITATTIPPTRTPPLPAIHSRSQSSGNVIQGSTRVDVQRAPFRMSGNNPFQRVSGGSKVVQDPPSVRSEAVEYDPLGVSK
ncbi:rab-GTPase-TBC domain-containing protein [Pisolithus tinctorius]|nr:rab-GTPase-TBC domain-containing protein [Pisolithus tinctorius]